MIETMLGDIPVLQFPIFKKYKGLLAFATTRTNDFSLAPDSPENREKLAYEIRNIDTIHNTAAFSASAALVFLSQVHSDNIIVINTPPSKNPEADGALTNKKGIILCGQSADCPIVLLYDPINQISAMAHSGWRGTKLNIAQKIVQKMAQLGSNPKNIIAAISPAIGRCCYEVGSDVFDALRTTLTDSPATAPIDSSAATLTNSPTVALLGSRDNYFSATKSGKYLIDLKQIIRAQLIRSGLSNQNIEISDYCTKCEEERFYSYRRDGEKSGRFAVCVGMV